MRIPLSDIALVMSTNEYHDDILRAQEMLTNADGDVHELPEAVLAMSVQDVMDYSPYQSLSDTPWDKQEPEEAVVNPSFESLLREEDPRVRVLKEQRKRKAVYAIIALIVLIGVGVWALTTKGQRIAEVVVPPVEKEVVVLEEKLPLDPLPSIGQTAPPQEQVQVIGGVIGRGTTWVMIPGLERTPNTTCMLSPDVVECDLGELNTGADVDVYRDIHLAASSLNLKLPTYTLPQGVSVVQGVEKEEIRDDDAPEVETLIMWPDGVGIKIDAAIDPHTINVGAQE